MSLDKELRSLDEAKIIGLFGDIWATPKKDDEALREFLNHERDKAFVRYPGLHAIRICLEHVGSDLIESGSSREEVSAMLVGMTMMATVLLAYAESEIEP